MKKAETIDAFRKIKRNWQEMGKRVLELCRHPEATPTQVYEAAQRYRVVSASVLEARRQIDAILDQDTTTLRWRWNDARDLEKP